jgi:uncharacterized protein (TIGR04255 family)
MKPWPKLSKAPLVEGLIDIRVRQSSIVSSTELKFICDELAGDFPQRQELHNVVAQINFSPESSGSLLTASDGHAGYILRSTDGKWVAQFRLDGLTVSRLQPYESWDELKAKTAELWIRYAQSVKPTSVTRVATRFINRIQLPNGVPFENTFQTTFVIGSSLPQTVSEFLLRFVLPFEQEQALAIVTQAFEKSHMDGTDCILDLDIFSEFPDGLIESEMWARLEVLRLVKNRLFFESLTDSALESYK